MKKSFVSSASALILAAGLSFGAESSWTDAVSFKGDLRLRHEYIDQDDKSDTRNRWRLRARVSMKGKVNDRVDVHLRLASGSDDPVSTNQSLDDGFSSKDINLDRAYVDWRPELLGGTSLKGGKMAQPFIAVKDLVWDSDLNPEGIAYSYTGGDAFKLTANAAALWAEERSAADDTMLYGLQLAGEGKPSETVSVMGGVSYFLWDNIIGFGGLVDDDFFGNSTVAVSEEEDADEVFVNDYGVLEFFYKIGIKAAMPISLYGDYIVNTEAHTDGDTGMLFGVKLGKAKEVNSWEFDYNYRDLEADATVGAFVDSDSFGGGTNGDGHKLSGKYQIAKNLQGGVSLFLNTIDPDGKDVDYTRAQFDLIAKF